MSTRPSPTESSGTKGRGLEDPTDGEDDRGEGKRSDGSGWTGKVTVDLPVGGTSVSRKS